MPSPEHRPPARRRSAARARTCTRCTARATPEVRRPRRRRPSSSPAVAFTAIMGPSGSGKSTLMHCLAGLDSATVGPACSSATPTSPTLNDKHLTRLRRDQVGFVFQAFNLRADPDRAGEHHAAAGHRRAASPTRSGSTRSSTPSACATGSRHRPSRALRRAAAARRRGPRAGAPGPRSIFADEPTGNLDSRSGAEVLGLPARGRSTTSVRPSSWSPTTPRRPPTPTACCSWPTAGSSTRCDDPTAEQVLERMKALRRLGPGGLRCSRATLRSLGCAQAPAGAVRARRRPRRRLRRRHPGLHRHPEEDLRRPVHPDRPATSWSSRRATTSPREGMSPPRLWPRCPPRSCRPSRAWTEWRRPWAGSSSTGSRSWATTARSSEPAAPRPTEPTGSSTPSSAPCNIVDGRGPLAAGEVAVDSRPPTKAGLAVGDVVSLVHARPAGRGRGRGDLPLRHHRATSRGPPSWPSTRPPPSTCCWDRDTFTSIDVSAQPGRESGRARGARSGCRGAGRHGQDR